MNPRRRKFAAALALVVVMLVASCSGVPSTGEPVDYTRIAEPGAAAVESAVTADLSPLEVVRGFVSAMRGIDQDQRLTAARAFLTSAASTRWQSADTPTEVMILVGSPRILVDAKTPEKVNLSGQTDSYLDVDGAYIPTQRGDYRGSFTLVQENGQWRINELPTELIMRSEDFRIAYTSREIYFLDHTESLVVPDRRWIVNVNREPELIADVLVDKLLSGPSTFLKPAVRSDFRWVTLAKNVTVSDDGALQVDLTYNADQPGAPQLTTATRRALAAQLVYTLSTEVKEVAITLDGERLDDKVLTWSTSTLNSFNPSSVPGTNAVVSEGWFVADNGGIQNLNGEPMYGDAGNGVRHLTSAAMSAASGFVAAVGSSYGDNVLYLGEPLSRKTLEARTTSSDVISTPSFNRTGDEAWVVLNGTTKPVIQRYLAAGGLYNVDTAALDAIAPPITALALSPDGVRIALIANKRLYLAVVVFTETKGTDGAVSTTGANASVENVTPFLNNLSVGAMSWEDSQTILVAATDNSVSPYQIGFRVGVDGRSYSELPRTPQDVESITAGQPIMVAFGHRIYKLSTEDNSDSWVPAGVGGTPLSGGSPFYPH